MKFTPVAQRKLDDLLADGWEISGYSIFRDGRHGFVTAGALVGWWRSDEDFEALLEREIQRRTALLGKS